MHTFRADIDYAHAEALTKVGIIGIKVWICRGEIYGKKDLAPSFSSSKDNRSQGGGAGRGERGGEGGGSDHAAVSGRRGENQIRRRS